MFDRFHLFRVPSWLTAVWMVCPIVLWTQLTHHRSVFCTKNQLKIEIWWKFQPQSDGVVFMKRIMLVWCFNLQRGSWKTRFWGAFASVACSCQSCSTMNTHEVWGLLYPPTAFKARTSIRVYRVGYLAKRSNVGLQLCLHAYAVWMSTW